MYPYTKEGRAATADGKEGGHEEGGAEGVGAEVEVSGMAGGWVGRVSA